MVPRGEDSLAASGAYCRRAAAALRALIACKVITLRESAGFAAGLLLCSGLSRRPASSPACGWELCDCGAACCCCLLLTDGQLAHTGATAPVTWVCLTPGFRLDMEY